MISTSDYLIYLILGAAIAWALSDFKKFQKTLIDFFFENQKEERAIRTCPRCGSTHVAIDADNYKGLVNYSGRHYYVCKRCGFHNHTFPEMSDEKARNFGENKGGGWREEMWTRSKKIRNPYKLYLAAGLILFLMLGLPGMFVIFATIVLYHWLKKN
jgi:DNA-directed RNA polymerase subunit RPC12/RpoP